MSFALLSIAWNSRGYFSASSGITTENWNELNSRTITLNKDINLGEPESQDCQGMPEMNRRVCGDI